MSPSSSSPPSSSSSSCILSNCIFPNSIILNCIFAKSTQLPHLLSVVRLIALLPGVHVSTIATKTSDRGYAGSKARLVVEICDSHGTCCQTSSDGLDNPGQYRKSGQTNVYTNTTILGNCAQEVIHILTLVQWYFGGEKRSWFKIIFLLCFW